jgi:hypothetical protein
VDDSNPPSTAGSRAAAEHLLQRGGPACGGRPGRPGGRHLRQPGHRGQARPSPMPRLQDKWRASPVRCARSASVKGRPGGRLHADDPAGPGGHAACARLGAVHSVVFGGFAPKELATRINDAKPKAIISPPAASSRGGSSPTSRCSTRPSRWPSTSPSACTVIVQREQAKRR